MFGFCGCLNFERGAVELSVLKRMCGLHSVGCAFINKEYGVLCDGVDALSEPALQPVTVRYNNALFTAAVLSDRHVRSGGSLAEAVLEGYIEEGAEYVRRLDFPYALALYDGRCGELLLAKGHAGDKPLFYTVKDGAVYFASSLRPLVRLYGGCVRINKRILKKHLEGEYTNLPEGLFCDIFSVRAGHSLLCSRLGQSDVPTLRGVYAFDSFSDSRGDVVPLSARADMRRALTDALFAFDYPQFDCYMPSLMEYLSAAKSRGARHARVGDPTAVLCSEYAAERADRLGTLWDVEIMSVPAPSDAWAKKSLKSMEKELDGILGEYLSSHECILRRLTDTESIESIGEEKSIPLRIRKKGMLCQTAMWFESFNLVLV